MFPPRNGFSRKPSRGNKSREIRRQISEKNKKANGEKDATYIV
jgi:hypothetical protein